MEIKEVTSKAKACKEQLLPEWLDQYNNSKSGVTAAYLTVQQFIKCMIYEENNQYNRTKITNAVCDILHGYKTMDMLYDYKVICDKTNNTQEVIDRNEIKLAILTKEEKGDEFLLSDFIGRKTPCDLSEALKENLNI